MEKTRKPNWTKEEEFTLISEVESAGESLRGSGNCADINKKKKQLWINILTREIPNTEMQGLSMKFGKSGPT